MTYHFELPIIPRAQKRDRIAAIGGHARSYKDSEQAQYEGKIRALLAQNAPEKPLEGAVNITIVCYLPIPASWSKKKRAAALQPIPRASIRPTTKPDCSNLVKNVEDVMNGIVYQDDRQIVGLFVTKWYSDAPRWEIEVSTID